MKRERVRTYEPGQPLVTGRMNQLVRSARRDIVGHTPIMVHSVGDSWQITHDPHEWDWFPARIQSRSSDFSDQRYWIRPQNVANEDEDPSDLLVWSDAGTVPSDLDVVVENLAEKNGTHLLKVSDVVVVFRQQDDSAPPLYRHFMVQPPPPCIDDDFPTADELDDLTSDIVELTADASSGATMSDLRSDVTAYFVRGHMYQDANSDLNPWFVATLPLCVDSDYQTWSDLSDLAIPDITIDPADSDIRNVLVTGHMYQDEASDLNPWFSMRLPLCVNPSYSDWSDLSDATIPGGGTVSDITGDLAGDSDTNFLVTGYMYKDANSDLNPWTAIEGTPIKIITGWRVSDLIIQVKTRTVMALGALEESDWHTAHEGSDCE